MSDIIELKKMIYINQPLGLDFDLIDSDTGQAIATAQSAEVAYKSPSELTGIWPARVEGSRLICDLPALALNEVGTWKAQGFATLTNGLKFPATTYSFKIDEYFK